MCYACCAARPSTAPRAKHAWRKAWSRCVRGHASKFALLVYWTDEALCVCPRARACVCVCVCARAHACVRVWVWGCARAHACVCACGCGCAWACMAAWVTGCVVVFARVRVLPGVLVSAWLVGWLAGWSGGLVCCCSHERLVYICILCRRGREQSQHPAVVHTTRPACTPPPRVPLARSALALAWASTSAQRRFRPCAATRPCSRCVRPAAGGARVHARGRGFASRLRIRFRPIGCAAGAVCVATATDSLQQAGRARKTQRLVGAPPRTRTGTFPRAFWRIDADGDLPNKPRPSPRARAVPRNLGAGALPGDVAGAVRLHPGPRADGRVLCVCVAGAWHQLSSHVAPSPAAPCPPNECSSRFGSSTTPPGAAFARVRAADRRA